MPTVLKASRIINARSRGSPQGNPTTQVRRGRSRPHLSWRQKGRMVGMSGLSSPCCFPFLASKDWHETTRTPRPKKNRETTHVRRKLDEILSFLGTFSSIYLTQPMEGSTKYRKLATGPRAGVSKRGESGLEIVLRLRTLAVSAVACCPGTAGR